VNIAKLVNRKKDSIIVEDIARYFGIPQLHSGLRKEKKVEEQNW
jgi:hypothetical protein